MRRKKAYVVFGLGYGDEGKGAVVDYLTRTNKPGFVVRYNGGPQAAHHVRNPRYPEKYHCFSQFSSGTFVPKTCTYLSRFMLIEPFALAREYETLCKAGFPDAIERLYIDERCQVVTPYDKLLGRALEISRGHEKHGTTGMGVGVAAEQRLGPSLSVKDFGTQGLRDKLVAKEDQAALIIKALSRNRSQAMKELLKWWRQELDPFRIADKYNSWFKVWGSRLCDWDRINNAMNDGTSSVVLEGAQGVLLDPVSGFAPYVTKTPCSYVDVWSVISSDLYKDVTRIGVIRTYMTRHGPGPLVTEDRALNDIVDVNNNTNRWQGPLRKGWLDLVALAYSNAATRSTTNGLFVTCLDQFRDRKIKICESYEIEGSLRTIRRYFHAHKKGKSLIITGIKPTYRSNRSLTKWLLKCKPHSYTEFEPNDRIRFLGYLSLRMDLPVLGYSYGPFVQRSYSIEE